MSPFALLPPPHHTLPSVLLPSATSVGAGAAEAFALLQDGATAGCQPHRAAGEAPIGLWQLSASGEVMSDCSPSPCSAVRQLHEGSLPLPPARLGFCFAVLSQRWRGNQ